MSVVRAALAVMVVLAAACGGGGAPSDGDQAAAASDPAATEPSEEPTTAFERPPVGVQGFARVVGKEDLTGQAKVALTIEANEGKEKGLGSSGQTGVSFDPNLVKVDPGAKITVTVKNTGRTDHDFTMASEKIKVKVAPGESKNVRVKMPADAGLRFYCSLHAPMVGAFYSQDGQTVNG